MIVRILLATFALGAALVTTQRAAAQGVPLGTTTIAGGRPDSLFRHFLAFLPTHGDSAVSVDAKRRTIEAIVKGADEHIIFAFVSRGDSTAVTAQGKRGGMAALIFGLGVVSDWLETRRAVKPDSGR